jgi:hypothetical protein
MTGTASEQGERGEEMPGESRIDIPGWPAFGYHRDDITEARGMQVAWRVRIADEPEAADLENRLNTAIMELLQWASRHPR